LETAKADPDEPPESGSDAEDKENHEEAQEQGREWKPEGKLG
jgi:hypothetical protein